MKSEQHDFGTVDKSIRVFKASILAIDSGNQTNQDLSNLEKSLVYFLNTTQKNKELELNIILEQLQIDVKKLLKTLEHYSDSKPAIGYFIYFTCRFFFSFKKPPANLFKCLEDSAEAGYAPAQNQFGTYLIKRVHSEIAQDLNRGFNFLKHAADQGSKDAEESFLRLVSKHPQSDIGSKYDTVNRFVKALHSRNPANNSKDWTNLELYNLFQTRFSCYVLNQSKEVLISIFFITSKDDIPLLMQTIKDANSHRYSALKLFVDRGDLSKKELNEQFKEPGYYENIITEVNALKQNLFFLNNMIIDNVLVPKELTHQIMNNMYKAVIKSETPDNTTETNGKEALDKSPKETPKEKKSFTKYINDKKCIVM
jgi:TPR repeat protein